MWSKILAEIKMLKRLVEFSRQLLVAAVMFLFSLSDKPSAKIIAALGNNKTKFNR